MQFYRRLTQIKAISFDLDDNLYNNRPIMQAIEKQMTAYFADKFAQLLPEVTGVFNRKFWAPYRAEAIEANADVSHDVVRHRFESYRLGFLAHNLTGAVATQEAQAGLDYFISLRSDFTVPKESVALLESLSKQYPLVAISNGNVDTQAIGISHYFQHIYHAGYQNQNTLAGNDSEDCECLLRMKPSTDMFDEVCKQLNILPAELLHVGDCGVADIRGALNAGCQSAWLSKYDVGKPLKQVPHIELREITELSSLLR